MKYLKILSSFVIAIFLFLMLPNYHVLAHNENLGLEGADGITYDPCVPSFPGGEDIGDGYDEKWYSFLYPYHDFWAMEHIDEDLKTLYYKIYPNTEIDLPESYIEVYKEYILEGINKWNKICYYEKDINGILHPRHIVNLVNVDDLENGNEIETNIDIYFKNPKAGAGGSTCPVFESEVVEDHQEYDGYIHRHFTKYEIVFSFNGYLGALPSSFEKVATHEIGHVLGLEDIDCNEYRDDLEYHHQELLMGYDCDILFSSGNITYKDLAGVLITRGIHTNADHEWLYDKNSSSANHYKLICRLCNCVKYVNNLSDYEYYPYKLCGGDHNLASGNMMPVAQIWESDFWKCKYCRYVTNCGANSYYRHLYAGSCDENTHIAMNTVQGLEYKIEEEHQFTIDLGNNIYKCRDCPMCSDGQKRVVNAPKIDFSCLMNDLTFNLTLDKGEYQLYQINVECPNSYAISLNGNDNVAIELFNERYEMILSTDAKTNSLNINRMLTKGTYYLRVRFKYNKASGSLTLNIFKPTSIFRQTVSYFGSYNIYEHMHSSHTEYDFYNSYDRFVRLKLETSNTNPSIFAEGTIIVKNSDGTIVNKFPFLDYYEEAKSYLGQNELIVYMEKNTHYIIEISFDSTLSSSASLVISVPTGKSYDAFSQTPLELINNDYLVNDQIICVSPMYSGKYQINLLMNNYRPMPILFVIFELDQNDNVVLLETIKFGKISSSSEYSYVLNAYHPLYVGVFGQNTEGMVSITFSQIINNPGGGIVVDPDVHTPSGTEVSLNGGVIRGSNITQGYTRLAYLDNGSPSRSRLDYDWYSSNDDVLEVSQFGTLLAHNVTTNQVVTIMAIYKKDPSISYRKSFNVLVDNKPSRMHFIEYNINIPLYGKWQVVPDEKWPSGIIQNYTWTSNNNKCASVDLWGYIRANASGNVIIYGDYLYNNKYRIIINVNVA